MVETRILYLTKGGKFFKLRPVMEIKIFLWSKSEKSIAIIIIVS